MNHKTTDFEELTSRWSSGDNVYRSGCQLEDASPSTIFEIAFSNKSKKFFADLINNNSPSNLNESNYTVSPWIDLNMDKNSKSSDKYINIKQRNLTLQAVETGIAFFLRKNITTNITQTAFFQKDDGCIIIYSVAQSRTETKESDHMIIDRWTIKWVSDPDKPKQEKDKKRVSVTINANIIWKTYLTPTATIVKSKWLRFYQCGFETWRKLINEYIIAFEIKSKKMVLMAPYIGMWNKINAFHLIKIMYDKIEYSDGSKFGVCVNEKTNEITANYSSATFTGKLKKNKNKNIEYESIEWNNGSIWIKNGFTRFEGEYKHNKTQQKYIVNELGTITLPITGRKLRFKLLKYNKITYMLNDNVSYKGILSPNRLIIEWDDGSCWGKTSQPKVITISKHSSGSKSANVPLFEKNENAEMQEEEEIIQEVQEVEKMQKMYNIQENIAIEEKSEEIEGENKKTAEIEGEMEESEHSDFEQDFDIYFKQNIPSLQVDNDEHFVLINDDQLLEMDQEHNIDENDKVNEWFLV